MQIFCDFSHTLIVLIINVYQSIEHLALIYTGLFILYEKLD